MCLRCDRHIVILIHVYSLLLYFRMLIIRELITSHAYNSYLMKIVGPTTRLPFLVIMGRELP